MTLGRTKKNWYQLSAQRLTWSEQVLFKFLSASYFNFLLFTFSRCVSSGLHLLRIHSFASIETCDFSLSVTCIVSYQSWSLNTWLEILIKCLYLPLFRFENLFCVKSGVAWGKVKDLKKDLTTLKKIATWYPRLLNKIYSCMLFSGYLKSNSIRYF